MEIIGIGGKFSRPGAKDIDVLVHKLHDGPSPHAVIVDSQETVVGGQPIGVDKALEDELRKRPGYVFNESFRVVASAHPVRLVP